MPVDDPYATILTKRIATARAHLAVGKPPDLWFDTVESARESYDKRFRVFEIFADDTFCGDGIEIGAGMGVGGACLSHRNGVESIVMSDVDERLVREIMPKTVALMGDGSKKIKMEVVDFEDMRLGERSFNYVIAFATLHHANQLSKTLSCCYEILKDGGRLLAVERVHPDTMTERKRDALLAVGVSDEFKIQGGLPVELRITRKDLGEHEYRLSDWMEALEKSGFDARIIWADPGLMRNRWFNLVFWMFAPLLAVLKAARLARGKALPGASTVYKLYYVSMHPVFNIFYWFSMLRYLRDKMFGNRRIRMFGAKRRKVLKMDPRWLFGTSRDVAVNAYIIAEKR